MNTGFHINYSSHFQNICSSFSFLVIITEAIIRLQRYIDHIFKIHNQGTRSDLCLKQREYLEGGLPLKALDVRFPQKQVTAMA